MTINVLTAKEVSAVVKKFVSKYENETEQAVSDLDRVVANSMKLAIVEIGIELLEKFKKD